jgi:glycosyltransferase involved in cell wall biosynthesis
MQRVTIAMPSFNEEHYIEDCIASVQAQDYPAELIEILVADGRSTDRTREILARLSAADPRIRMVDNPARLQAAGLGLLVKEATGDVIVRMDVHAEYAPDYVRRCVETLEKTGADNVGGAQRARAKTAFQRALCAALSSPLGVGGAKYRSPLAEASSTPCSSARSGAASSRRSACGTRARSRTRTPSSTSASSTRAARSTCRRTSSCTTSRATT